MVIGRFTDLNIFTKIIGITLFFNNYTYLAISCNQLKYLLAIR